MTTGEQLSSLSGLPSGTAMSHLLAIQTGGGAVETIFASTMRVVTSTPEVFAHRISRRTKAAPKVSVPKATGVVNKQPRIANAYVKVAENNAFASTEQEEVFVRSVDRNEVVAMSARNSVVAKRKNGNR